MRDMDAVKHIYFVLFWEMCALLDALFNESHFSLNKSVCTYTLKHTLINHITESIENIGKKGIFQTTTHTHICSFNLSCLLYHVIAMFNSLSKIVFKFIK